MSSSDYIFACGCGSFAADCRSPGSGSSCKKHQGWSYAATWEDNRRNPVPGKSNWGACERPYKWNDASLAAELAKFANKRIVVAGDRSRRGA